MFTVDLFEEDFCISKLVHDGPGAVVAISLNEFRDVAMKYPQQFVNLICEVCEAASSVSSATEGMVDNCDCFQGSFDLNPASVT